MKRFPSWRKLAALALLLHVGWSHAAAQTFSMDWHTINDGSGTSHPVLVPATLTVKRYCLHHP